MYILFSQRCLRTKRAVLSVPLGRARQALGLFSAHQTPLLHDVWVDSNLCPTFVQQFL